MKRRRDIEDIIGSVLRFVFKLCLKIFLMCLWTCFRFAELLFGSLSGWLKKLISKS
ncbi:MAG: hypothetical protein JJE25_14405 [Bacteroidia bacterium]|nr:hypothetical protein [Bacteroidia bacterium]